MEADGACGPPAVPFCEGCDGSVVARVPPVDCPAESCPGSIVYGVCVDSCWGTCSCSIPSGYTLVDAGFFAPEAGDAEVGPDAADALFSDDRRTD